MAKFVYRMQNILELKENLESQERIAFGLANAALQEEQEKLGALLARRSEYEKRLKELTEGALDIKEIRHCKDAINVMKTKIRDQMIEVRKAQQALEVARKRLDDIIKDRKTHEKLKEKAFEEFKIELAAEESKEVDQLVSFTYHSNQDE